MTPFPGKQVGNCPGCSWPVYDGATHMCRTKRPDMSGYPNEPWYDLVCPECKRTTYAPAAECMFHGGAPIQMVRALASEQARMR